MCAHGDARVDDGVGFDDGVAVDGRRVGDLCRGVDVDVGMEGGGGGELEGGRVGRGEGGDEGRGWL